MGSLHPLEPETDGYPLRLPSISLFKGRLEILQQKFFILGLCMANVNIISYTVIPIFLLNRL